MRILCFPFTECKKAVPWKNYFKKSIFVFAISYYDLTYWRSEAFLDQEKDTVEVSLRLYVGHKM